MLYLLYFEYLCAPLRLNIVFLTQAAAGAAALPDLQQICNPFVILYGSLRFSSIINISV
jgi:hypothetical protein